MFILLYTGKPNPCKTDAKLVLPYRGARTYHSTQRRRSFAPVNLDSKEVISK